jgi:hypothetical protein
MKERDMGGVLLLLLLLLLLLAWALLSEPA